MTILIGAVVGAFIGYLLRPSALLVGQLPLDTILEIAFKAWFDPPDLGLIELALVNTAKQSVNYMVGGALAGGFVGWLATRRR